jgi:hypothetical protein
MVMDRIAHWQSFENTNLESSDVISNEERIVSFSADKLRDLTKRYNAILEELGNKLTEYCYIVQYPEGTINEDKISFNNVDHYVFPMSAFNPEGRTSGSMTDIYQTLKELTDGNFNGNDCLENILTIIGVNGREIFFFTSLSNES